MHALGKSATLSSALFGNALAFMLWIALTVIAASPAFAAEASPGEAKPANPLNAERAMGYLRQICAIGPRPAGSPAMDEQRKLLTDHFRSLGGEVERQGFLAPNPLGGAKVPMANLIVRYRPELTRRVVLCAHYDTRPLPDQDPNWRARRSGRFIGANDGASGVALLMELAHLMPELTGDVGVDLVMFDGEELVYQDPRDPYFLGSSWFARQYKNRSANYVYEWGVLFDMVGDKDLQIYQERNSWRIRQTRPLVKSLWATAARLGVEEFKPRLKHTVRDDHLPLNAAGIPTCDLIDFDYPYWHTEADTPRKCSGESLAKVGWVAWEWLWRLDQSGVATSANSTGEPTTTGAVQGQAQ
ncbi:MAG: M28 family peptidase [Planctomycetota bacterium]